MTQCLEERLIAFRIAYYYPEKVKKDLLAVLIIPDSDYDKMERELMLENSESFLFNMVEVSFKHPLVQKVATRICKNRLLTF